MSWDQYLREKECISELRSKSGQKEKKGGKRQKKRGYLRLHYDFWDVVVVVVVVVVVLTVVAAAAAVAVEATLSSQTPFAVLPANF